MFSNLFRQAVILVLFECYAKDGRIAIEHHIFEC